MKQYRPIVALLLALACWVAISGLDAQVKGSFVVSWQETGRPWTEAPEFWKDTAGTVVKWRNCLVVLSVLVVFTGLAYGHRDFVYHFVSMFPCEFVGYWLWVAALGLPQQQNFGGVWRTPSFGEVPTNPIWLPDIYRALQLHRPLVVALIVAVNVGVAIWRTWKWSERSSK